MSVMLPQSEESKELRQACHELRSGLRAGKATRVEDLLARYPELAANDEAVLGLIPGTPTGNRFGPAPDS